MRADKLKKGDQFMFGTSKLTVKKVILSDFIVNIIFKEKHEDKIFTRFDEIRKLEK